MLAQTARNLCKAFFSPMRQAHFAGRIIYVSVPSITLIWGFVEDGFGSRMPIYSVPGPVRARGHHAGHGVRESMMHSSAVKRLLPRKVYCVVVHL